MSTAGPPRISPGGLRELGLPNWVFAQVSGIATGSSAPNIFRTLGRHRGLFRGWLIFASRLMPGGKLSRRETEMVIIRVAKLRGSAYELAHHRRIGRRCGISKPEIARIVEGGAESGPWTDRERTLLATAERLIAARNLSDEEWARLRGELDEREAIELLMLVGHYDMLAMVIETLRLDEDRPRRGRG